MGEKPIDSVGVETNIGIGTATPILWEGHYFFIIGEHLVGDSLRLIFSESETYPGEVVATNKDLGLAIVKSNVNKKVKWHSLEREGHLRYGDIISHIGYTHSLLGNRPNGFFVEEYIGEDGYLRIVVWCNIIPGSTGGGIFKNGYLVGIVTKFHGDANVGIAVSSSEVLDWVREVLP